ncbi:MAG: hypothetical protein N3I35_13105 [Clostridia bacterium]|nr:hypothetical protein [Clostridia bacterium]
MENVLEKVCDEKHKSINDRDKVVDTRLNSHSGRLDSVEDAVVKLTAMVEEIRKKYFFDKILILCVFIMVIVVASIELGPELTGKMIGGMK